ncbi:hypothetical protein BSR29_07460 [Boudabousia liubingyangii]|uniref:Uncharacterized protein n=1 Tax=Boudabousia liubingyangii TaxID=1921764 RepID=A0A1Q5PK90_9ACTO|nr:DUF6286 domain-containing protein [Boudabousia liubingyangii]OKL46645.1 hypothetical protein BSR29_07460 [Boudabousia liubingyangii]OKL46767.1 hypothetical protein BSR28_04810 [Boudabousia liubingyangii]
MTQNPKVDNPQESRNATEGPHVGYISRRATHSSRAFTAVVISLLLLAGSVYLLIELTLATLGYQPLLATPEKMLNDIPVIGRRVIYPWLAVGGIAGAILGIIFLIKALAPGSLGRHRMDAKRAAVIVDDQVIASAVSAALRNAAGLGQGQVSTSVDRTHVIATVTPHAGRELDRELLQQTLKETVAQMELLPKVKTKLNLITPEKES